METKVVTVTNAKPYYRRATVKPSRHPTIRLQGDWLNGIGFNWGKLATAEYGQGQIILRLQDSGNYKDLVKSALKTSSGLFQIRRETGNKLEFPRLDIQGFRLEQIGFIPDSVVIVSYEYGLIKLSLVDIDQLEKYQGEMEMGTRILKVTHAKAAYRRKPAIKLSGYWLDQIGFTSGKIVAGEYKPGKIILRPLDGNHQELEKGALKASSGLFQVGRGIRNNRDYSHIDLKGFWLERFGFTIGKTFTVCYEYGLIKLLLIEPEKLI